MLARLGHSVARVKISGRSTLRTVRAPTVRSFPTTSWL